MYKVEWLCAVVGGIQNWLMGCSCCHLLPTGSPLHRRPENAAHALPDALGRAAESICPTARPQRGALSVLPVQCPGLQFQLARHTLIGASRATKTARYGDCLRAEFNRCRVHSRRRGLPKLRRGPCRSCGPPTAGIRSKCCPTCSRFDTERRRNARGQWPHERSSNQDPGGCTHSTGSHQSRESTPPSDVVAMAVIRARMAG